jgi:endonuclease YncB( thermonuclease family)
VLIVAPARLRPSPGRLDARACILPAMRLALPLIVLAVLAGCEATARKPQPQAKRPASTGTPRPPASLPMPARPEPAAPVWRVVSVHDGDTLRAIDEGKVEQRIRLAGIDAPERGQAFGNVSRERLAALTMGQPVEVYIEDRDRYGRTVARLEAGGVDVCRQMVADGLAWHFTRYSDDPALAAAEIEARAERRGLWRDPAPVAPWDWRAGEAERKRQRAGRLPR